MWVGLEVGVGGGAGEGREPAKWFSSTKGTVMERAGKIWGLGLALPRPPWACGGTLAVSRSLSLLIREMSLWAIPTGPSHSDDCAPWVPVKHV